MNLFAKEFSKVLLPRPALGNGVGVSCKFVSGVVPLLITSLPCHLLWLDVRRDMALHPSCMDIEARLDADNMALDLLPEIKMLAYGFLTPNRVQQDVHNPGAIKNKHNALPVRTNVLRE